MQKRQIILIILGVLLAALAVVLIRVHISRQTEAIEEGAERKIAEITANQTAVLIAKQDIPKGAAIDANMLNTAIVPNKYIQPGAVTSLDRISDMVTLAPISKDEQIILSKLTYPKEARHGTLAEATPPGKRAITISLDNISALIGMARPGDYVDVVAKMSVPIPTAEGKTEMQPIVVPLFQNVLVLAVGRDMGAAVAEGRYDKAETKEYSPIITLALTPQEANLLSFVQEQGKIHLVLRSPLDPQVAAVAPVGIGDLTMFLQSIIPQPPRPEHAQEGQEEPTVTEYVEIYRGLNKERVPLR